VGFHGGVVDQALLADTIFDGNGSRTFVFRGADPTQGLDIAYSAIAIDPQIVPTPEPGSAGLALAAGAMLLLYSRRA